MRRAFRTNDISPNANAQMARTSGLPSQVMETVAFETAQEAFKAAIEAADSGKYDKVQVWVEGFGIFELPQINGIYKHWLKDRVGG